MKVVAEIMTKIEIRCKTCDKIHMEVEIEGKLKYDFRCKKCTSQHSGVIIREFGIQQYR